MRRLLSPSVIDTSRRRGRTPVAIPSAPAAFSRLLSQTVSCPRWAGAELRQRPSRFLEVMRVEMTHEEMDALLQRYDGLPVPMQAMIDSMVAEMVSGLDPDSEVTEWAARFWTAVLVRMALEAGGGADASDSE